MKIAQIAPLYESVPPKMYGGTERVVSYLTEELVAQGHEVTLFASKDSNTSAKLVSHVPEALRLNPEVKAPLAHHIIQMQEVIEKAEEFDILHFHTDYLHFPFSAQCQMPTVTTLHGRLDIPDLAYVYRKFSQQPLVSISNAQRKLLPAKANWTRTVYHGLPLDLYKKGNGDGEYAAFIGRISPEKRPDRAIAIAIRAGIKLKIAAKVDKADQVYFEEKIKPLLEHPSVEFIGEIGEDKKGAFLGNAKALLFPIDWPEPFGMVMIEAMACGTPVIAFKHGSVPEVIDKGESGFIVKSADEAVTALENIDLIDRNTVRETFERRFSASVMASNYLVLFEDLLSKKAKRLRKGNHRVLSNGYRMKKAN
ncbi:glycosyltransferase family 4 protein [Flammeovirgaceae bacterium SG7u.111]|nr:glycosyltransferase family 4 protein [Flammeovirgaceae bacterium SG7u.132]WPO36367.1 glycosyltransferase family 4 protein [Flammeovirgaceae bacterium SG7u.111]